ncbi:unnamed protein product, partial [Mesorhabditis belari]|uniref:Uncharacterized protein n=1 Tax=Mesorhabditis belari TaxID=2138241 RepID=A0AAF3EQF3_9BILA
MVLPVGAPSKAPTRHPHPMASAKGQRGQSMAPQQGQRHSQSIAPNVLVSQTHGQSHTEVQLGLGHTPHGGFFASSLFHSSGRSRPRALSMQPIPTSISSEEIQKKKMVKIEEIPTVMEGEAPIFRRIPSKTRGKPKYYPLNQDEAYEFMLLLNQQPTPYGSWI